MTAGIGIPHRVLRVTAQGLTPVLCLLALAGCDFMATEAPAGLGFAQISLSLGALGSPLAKRSRAMGKLDTVVTLKTLHLELVAPGAPTQSRIVKLAGNIQSESITPAAQLFGLFGMKNWKLRAWTQDANDSVIHRDSTTFFVVPGDTTPLRMPLNPRYSVLIGRFISHSDRIAKIEKLELRVDGVLVDDTVFSSKQRIFDIVLSDKYLRVGRSTKVEMRALDRTSPDRVKYSKSVVLDPDETVDSQITIQLD